MPVVVLPPHNITKMALDHPITRDLPLREDTNAVMPDGLNYVFIIFTHRTGSFYLSNLLATSGFFNYAQEELSSDYVLSQCRQDNLTSFCQYFSKLAEKNARNKYFVVKSTIDQLITVAWYGVLQRIISRSHFVFLERMDKLAQVISWSIADQTQTFDGPPDTTPVYDGEDLRDRLNRIAHAHAQTTVFMGLNGLVPLHLTYEIMVAAPQMCGRLVCDFVGCPNVRCDPALIKSRPHRTALNRAWRMRFLAEEARLTPTAGS